MTKQDTGKLLKELQARLSYIHKSSDLLDITNNESYGSALTVTKKAKRAEEIMSNSFNNLLLYMDALQGEYDKILTYLQDSLEEIIVILKNKVIRSEEETKFIHNFEKLKDDMHKTYVILMAEAPLKWLAPIIPQVLDELSSVSLSPEEIGEVNRNFQKAKYYNAKAYEKIPSVDITGLGTDLNRLEDIILLFNNPAQRPENSMLNQLISLTTDIFLDNGFSEKRAFIETGSLMLKYGYMEDSKHLPDSVRSRYKRYKNKNGSS